MINFHRYTLLEAHFPIDEMSPDNWKLWTARIAEIINNQRTQKSAFILTLGPNEKYSIGFDIGEVSQEGKFNGKKYLLTDITNVKESEILMLVDTDEFYLGYIILLLGEVTRTELEMLIILWDSEMIQSGAEFFRMDSDGSSFYWYNPRNIEKATEILYAMNKLE